MMIENDNEVTSFLEGGRINIWCSICDDKLFIDTVADDKDSCVSIRRNEIGSFIKTLQKLKNYLLTSGNYEKISNN